MKLSERLKEIENCYGKFGSQSDEVHIKWLIEHVKTLTKALEHLQNIEIEYAKDKENWEYVKTQLRMIRDDKYAGPQSLKHTDQTVGGIIEECLNRLTNIQDK